MATLTIQDETVDNFHQRPQAPPKQKKKVNNHHQINSNPIASRIYAHENSIPFLLLLSLPVSPSPSRSLRFMIATNSAGIYMITQGMLDKKKQHVSEPPRYYQLSTSASSTGVSGEAGKAHTQQLPKTQATNQHQFEKGRGRERNPNYLSRTVVTTPAGLRGRFPHTDRTKHRSASASLLRAVGESRLWR